MRKIQFLVKTDFPCQPCGLITIVFSFVTIPASTFHNCHDTISQFHFISYNTPLLFGDNVTKTLPYAERALVTLIFDGQPMECKTNIFELKPTMAHNAWVLDKGRFHKPFTEPVLKRGRCNSVNRSLEPSLRNLAI